MVNFSCLTWWNTCLKVDCTWDIVLSPLFSLIFVRLFDERDRIKLRVSVIVWYSYVTLLINCILVALIIWGLVYSFSKSSLIEAIYCVSLIARSESNFFVFIFRNTLQKAHHLWRKLLLFRPCWSLQRVSHIDSCIFTIDRLVIFLLL